MIPYLPGALPFWSFSETGKMNKSTLAVLFIVLLAACRPSGSSIPEKPVISVSILPQRYFIEMLAGDRVEVNVMVPPGASPATYEPTMAQLGYLDRSALYMRIGYVGFELSWMEKILSVNPSMKVADLSRGVELIRGEEQRDQNRHPGHSHTGVDPHIWMSARNARVIASNTYASLLEVLPAEQDLLSFNLSKLLKEIDSLDHAIAAMLDGLDHRGFMIYHPALSYFARDYNLQQYALEVEGKTPSPAHMKEMSDLGRERQITTIFLQQQFDVKSARVLADEIGARVVRIDPLDPDWKNQMLTIATRLKESD
jgi:zinc transport system substrate-binding protein